MIKNKTTTDHIVAYVDILGGKALIKSDNCDSYIDIVAQCYKKMLNTGKLVALDPQYEPLIKIFSDNILIAIPLAASDNNLKTAFRRMTVMVGVLQRAFLEYNILVRGAITTGKLFVDNIFVWGAALLRGYKLESEIAKHPRVICDPELIKKIVYNNYTLLEDKDGYYYVDYLFHTGSKEINELAIKALEYAKSKTKNGESNKVRNKYMWQKRYLRYVLKRATSEQKILKNKNKKFS